jgi:TPR repeat protein
MSIKILKFPSKEKIKTKKAEKELLQKAEEGEYSNFHLLAWMYESGHAVKKDTSRAIKLYKQFCKEHRKARVKIDLIEVIMKVGHLHMKEGNKYRAAEAYIEAIEQIIGDYQGKERDRAFKKYKIEKYLKKTGYQDLMI